MQATSLRIGLALSGGGLRATLYHLGVVRFLKDSGLLPSVTHVTSVSGGSVLAAHLVLNWDRYNGTTSDFDDVAQEVLEFVRLDVRNRIVRRYPFLLACSFLHRVTRQRPPRHWTRTGLLEQHYRDFLFGDTCLFQLPVRPELHVLATNLSEGGLSSFSRSGLFIETRGKSGVSQIRRHRSGLATVPMAVAASSAFPGFFPPLELTAEDIGANTGEFQTQYFTDGGVYDNLGVRMFRHLSTQQQSSLSGEDTLRLESAVGIWNRAAESQTMTPLRRLVEIYASESGGGQPLPGRSPIVSESGELRMGLEQLIADVNLSRDPQLRSLLRLDEHHGNGGSKGNGHGNGAGRAAEYAMLESADQVASNRRLINLAFREAIGEDVLSTTHNSFDAILASDAGKKFQVTRPDRSGSFLRTAMRSSDILMDRVWQLEKEHFAASTDYVFIPITRVVTEAEDRTALHPEVQVQVGRMRTDMDRFSDREVVGLVRHGYCVARRSIASRASLAAFTNDGPPWDPVTGPTQSHGSSVAQRSWRGRQAAEMTREARTLQRSSRRKYLGVVLSPRDWVSYLYLPLLFLVFALVPYLVYKGWRRAEVTSTLTTAIAETRHDYKTLLGLLESKNIEPWPGMAFVDARHLDPLFAEQGLDIIADTRITDLRGLGPDSRDRTALDELFVYVYRCVSVRKVKHCDGQTGLRLQWELPVIRARCHNVELHPELQRCEIQSDDGVSSKYAWQMQLDFRTVPVGHTTDVVVEALLPVDGDAEYALRHSWWRFEVDADPEVVTSWLLLPEQLVNRQPCLIRYQNIAPETVELVEPTHSSSILKGAILNWSVVHPKAGYTYSYRWDSSL